jgi:hypothetical protein
MLRRDPLWDADAHADTDPHADPHADADADTEHTDSDANGDRLLLQCVAAADGIGSRGWTGGLAIDRRKRR